MNYSIRLATAEDSAELTAMRFDSTAEDEAVMHPREGFAPDMAAFVREGVESGRWLIWVAEAAGVIVSNIYLCVIDKVPRPTRSNRRIAYMTNVYTQPGYRGRGIGGSILDEITGWPAANDVELITVWPSETSVALYRRHGFAPPSDLLVWSADE